LREKSDSKTKTPISLSIQNNINSFKIRNNNAELNKIKNKKVEKREMNTQV